MGAMDPGKVQVRGEAVEIPPLPILSEKPKMYPGCCLGLSSRLLKYLSDLMPKEPDQVLSIGSGYGLLEALLLAQRPSLPIRGVEVQPSSNRFLPASNHEVVAGTRFLHPKAAEATTWLFVYPKRVGLLEEYIRKYGAGCVNRLIWAGPKADWDDYKTCFGMPELGMSWQVVGESAENVGGRPWELIVVAEKRLDGDSGV